MLAVIIIIVVVVVLALGTGAFFLSQRHGSADRLEPPPSPPASQNGSGAPGVTTPAEVEPEPEPELVAEVEEALAPVTEPAAAEPEVEVEAPPAKVSFRDRLAKARGVMSGYLGSVLARSKIDAETWDELEEALIRADVGVATTGELLDELRTRVADEKITDPATLLDALKANVKERLAAERTLRYDADTTNVWLFVGVNGVGKTTTIGKLAKREATGGRTVVLAAGDTFRAAAAEQLETWAERAGADLVRGAEGADPSSVVFDAIERAAAKGTDLVLADTAGRLHTKSNLMEELRKVRRVADKDPGNVTEVLLVLDATTGQNGLTQARQFTEAVEVTGVVLTKLDGSAKGGIVLAIQSELDLPVKLVGLGEQVGDLVEFDPDEFTEALFSV